MAAQPKKTTSSSDTDTATSTEFAPSASQAPAAGPESLPTIGELVADGASKAEAYSLLVEQMALRCGKPSAEARELGKAVADAMSVATVGGVPIDPYFKIQAVTPHGSFWAIGQRFTSEPTKVPLSKLTEAQVKELKTTPAKFLAVTLVTHELPEPTAATGA